MSVKLEKNLHRDFDSLLSRIEKGILNSGISATLEETSDFTCDNNRCSVRIFERYSYFCKAYLTLSVTLFQCGNSPIQLSAVASGSGTSLFENFSKGGEGGFLKVLEQLL